MNRISRIVITSWIFLLFIMTLTPVVTAEAALIKSSPASITLDAKSATAYVGDKITLSATIEPPEATNAALTWKSSNSSVASVSSNGILTAKKAGTATITVTASGQNWKKSASCKVTVKTRAVKSVSLDQKKLTLDAGTKASLAASILPANATNKNVTWKSSKPSIASVNSKGVVTAKKKGSAVITVTTQSDKKKATCTVTVNTYAVKSVSLDKKTLTLDVGKKSTLAASILPANATNKALTWRSSKTSVATVDKNGKVTAKKAGTATITVTTQSGKKKAACKVTVVIPVQSVKLNASSKSLNIQETYQLAATVSPSNATDKKVTWSSSDSKVAAVDSKGKVTAKGKGTAIITAKAGEKSATCKITVTTPVRRAFLIGQKNYRDEPLLSSQNDLACMMEMLYAGGYDARDIHGWMDLTAAQMKQVIRSISSFGMTNDDVTLFYYTGHGVDSNTKKYRGALMGIDDQIVTVDEVQKLLDQVPGTVVVVMDCCLSGQYIQSKAIPFSTPSASSMTPDAFNQSVIDAFSGSAPLTKALTDSPYKSKYKIITACQPLENSVAIYRAGRPLSVFTYWFTKGGGFNYDQLTVAAMAADKNRDNAATLAELHSYILSGVKSESYGKQKAMAWPSNDDFPVVTRSAS